MRAAQRPSFVARREARRGKAAPVAGMALAAFAAFAPPARAGTVPRYTLNKDIDAGYKNGAYDKNGVYLATHPGGFYTGRLMVGQTFDRYDDTLGSNGSAYYWGYAVGNVGNCFWLGPSQPNGGEVDYLTPNGKGPDDRCTAAQRQWLGADFHSNISNDFNCHPAAPSDKATFGGYTQTTDATGLYFNLEWKWDGAAYTGGSARDWVADLPPGTGVYYRYTTRDGEKSVVFVPGYGWGFVNAAKVPHVKHWSPNGTQDPVPCDCKPDCEGKACGPNGCGGSCGACGGAQECQGNQCVCVPQCAGRSCGDDLCGGSCGVCGEGETCVDGQCVGETGETGGTGGTAGGGAGEGPGGGGSGGAQTSGRSGPNGGAGGAAGGASDLDADSANPTGDPRAQDGCACSAVERRAEGGSASLVLAGLALLLRRRHAVRR